MSLPISEQSPHISNDEGLVQKWLSLPRDQKAAVALGLIRGWLRGWRFDAHGFLIIGGNVHIQKRHGRLLAGRAIRIRPGCRIAVVGRPDAPALLSLGDDTELGDRTIINVTQRVEIGARCSISWDCEIGDSDFHFIRMAEGEPFLPVSAPVVIQDDVWVGSRSLILKGVTIGHGSIIGAGSVVRRDVPPHTLVAGNPARRVARVAEWKR